MAFYPGPGIGGHCLVGEESVVLRRSDDGRERVESFAMAFAEQQGDSRTRKLRVDGGEVIFKPRLEALSLDMRTQTPKWKHVRYLFRRPYDGPIVTIGPSYGRRKR